MRHAALAIITCASDFRKKLSQVS